VLPPGTEDGIISTWPRATPHQSPDLLFGRKYWKPAV